MIESQCLAEVSKNRLAVLVAPKVTGDFQLRPKLIFTILKILWPIKLCWIYLCFIREQQSLDGREVCLQHGLLNILNPCGDLLFRKQDSFQNTTLYWQCTWSARAPIEMYNEINVVFMSPNNNHFAPHESRNNFTFKFYNLRNIFH